MGQHGIKLFLNIFFSIKIFTASSSTLLENNTNIFIKKNERSKPTREDLLKKKQQQQVYLWTWHCGLQIFAFNLKLK